MMIKLIVAFCAFQIAFSQEDPEQDLLDFVAQTNEAILFDVNRYLGRMLALGRYVGYASRQLLYEEADLRQELATLAAQLSNNTDNVTIDVTDCLITAQNNIDTIMRDRRNEIEAFQSIAYNNLNQIMNDLYLVGDEEENLVNETEGAIETCRAAPTTEEVSSCYSQLLPIFDEIAEDIRNRLANLTSLGEEVLTISEGTLQTFIEGNGQYVDENTQDIRQNLTACIEDLY